MPLRPYRLNTKLHTCTATERILLVLHRTYITRKTRTQHAHGTLLHAMWAVGLANFTGALPVLIPVEIHGKSR